MHKGQTDSSDIPQWMKDYFAWHRKERANIREENWRDHQYLVARCLRTDPQCGGTADRLKPLPLLIFWAAKTKRILMFHWSRPCALEEFLLPPRGGVDWRLPEWMARHLPSATIYYDEDDLPKLLQDNRTFPTNTLLSGLLSLFRGDNTIVTTILQSPSGGAETYTRYVHTGTPSHSVTALHYNRIYRHVWRAFFTPSLPVQALIRQQMQRMDLVPGQYAAVHLRALYGVHSRSDVVLQRWARNAIACGTALRPGGPLYFASDSKNAVEYVQDWMAKTMATNSTSVRVVSIQRDYEPLHLEKATDWQSRHPSDYYDTFVDLYILSMSRCVSHNVGGYGQWGLWLGYNATCFNQNTNQRKLLPCEWHEGKVSGDLGPSQSDNDTMIPNILMEPTSKAVVN